MKLKIMTFIGQGLSFTQNPRCPVDFFLINREKLRVQEEETIKKAVLRTPPLSLIENLTSHNINELLSEVYQPLGSMPLACNSFLKIRLIQVAKDVSPSFFISVSSCSLNSVGSLIWYCGDLLNSCIDMCNYPCYDKFSVITIVLTFNFKSNKARKCCNTIGLLTKPLSEVTIMAMYKSTQTHPKFTFLFFAVRRADLSASPQRIKITAHSEREARSLLVGDFVLSFAGRLPVNGGMQ